MRVDIIEIIVIFNYKMRECNFFTEEEWEEINNKFDVKLYKNIISNKIDKNKEITLTKEEQLVYNRYIDKFIYKKEIPSFKDIKTVNLLNYLKKINVKFDEYNLVCYELKKDDYIYKGMRYFYTKKLENEYFKENRDQQFWFAKEDIASMYAQRYFGSVSAYKVTKNITLIDLNNPKNIKILSQIFKDNSKSKELCAKLGINCNIMEQIPLILKIKNWGNEIWLRKKYQIEDDEICYKDNRTWGSGSIDRVVSKLIFKTFNQKIQGWLYKDFESPFFAGKMLGELCLFDTSYFERDTSNKYDWYQWRKYLPFKIPNQQNFIFNQKLAKNNTNFRLLLFYFENMKKKIFHN